jgi:uncharacterized protein (DUF362 family)
MNDHVSLSHRERVGVRAEISRREVLKLLATAPLWKPESTAAHIRALETAVEKAGGLPVVRKGGTVLLKVNTNSGDPAPYSTSPIVVAWFTPQYVAQGVRVVVGDRSFWGDHDTMGNLERNGIAPAARRAGAEVRAFETRNTEWTELDPSVVPSWIPPVRVPTLAMKADALINLACAKTHFITGVTLGKKNTLGLVCADDRAREGNLKTHDPRLIHRQYSEIHAALPIALTVIDGFDALVSGGPTPRSGAPPTIVRTGVVLASRDPDSVEQEAKELLAKYG